MPAAVTGRSWRRERAGDGSSCVPGGGGPAGDGWMDRGVGSETGERRELGSAVAFGISLADWHSFVPVAGKLAQRPSQPSVAGCWDSRPYRRAEVPCYWGLPSPRNVGSYNVQIIPDPVSAKSSLCTFPTMIFPLK